MANNTPVPITCKTSTTLTKSIQFSSFLRYPVLACLPVEFGDHLPQPAIEKRDKPVKGSCLD